MTPAGGRLAYDGSVETLWERDTRTLPRYLQAWRRAYRRFAQQQIAPLALDADRLPQAYDPHPLLAQAGRSSRSYRSGESFEGDIVVTLGLERHDEAGESSRNTNRYHQALTSRRRQQARAANGSGPSPNT